METLSASETFVEVAFAATAIVVALWSIAASLRSRKDSPATGELVWTLVAAAILVGVLVAVRLGSGHAV